MTAHIDPEQAAEVDGDQLSAGDTLDYNPVEEVHDEGYSPQSRDTRDHWGETALEEILGEPLDARLAQEVPDVWDVPGRGRESDRSGRLEDSADGPWQQDRFARDVGVAGGAASAEEAAMHTTTLEELREIEEREALGLEPLED